MVIQDTFTIETPGRTLINITSKVENIVAQSKVKTGLCNVFLHHTSASLIICENSDITVQQDLENFMQRIAPDGTQHYAHSVEGPDDMPSHIRSVLTENSISFPISHDKLSLGTWQGIYLWEHRHAPNSRKITVTVIG